MDARVDDLPQRRPERAADEPFLFALFAQMQGASLSGLDPALRMQLLRQIFAGQRLTYRTRYPRACYEVLEHRGAPIGRLILDEASEVVTLVAIAFLPEWRGLGLGASLLRGLCAAVEVEGRSLRLSVEAGNLGARRLYARLGFVPVGGDALHVAMRRG